MTSASQARSLATATPRRVALALLFGGILAACAGDGRESIEAPPAEPRWIPLFNGRDLDGWIVKIRGLELGRDPLRTFRVEDGVLKVDYSGYESFDGRFGHLFYSVPFERYRLRVEYRFLGEQAAGGPGWAFRNSGAMLHCQAPETMRVDQEFPVSIEAQMLGGDGEHARSTANLCTPGTNVVMNGELVTRHCIDSTSKTYHGDDWVAVEIEVHSGDVIRHWMEGEVVLEYTAPELDPNDVDAQRLLALGAPKMLAGGYISVQAESHPLEFRRIELLPLE
jgi:hypothetical protein